MTWHEYTEMVRRTYPSDLAVEQRRVNFALGLLGELAELAMDFTPDEVGDVLWYTFALADTCDLSIQSVTSISDFETLQTRAQTFVSRTPPSKDACWQKLFAAAGGLAEQVKVATFHGRHFSKVEAAPRFAGILWYLAILCVLSSLDISLIPARNLVNLQRRYPQGFESPAAGRRVV